MVFKPKLYVHIGTHKTGTTSIQTFLLENRGLLKRKGVITPKESIFNDFGGFDEQLFVKYHTRAEEIIYSFINDRNTGYFLRDIEYYENKLALKIQKELLSKNKDIIISSESFFDNHTTRFNRRMELLKKIIEPYKEKFDVKIIIYYRAQDSFIESMFMMYNIICYYALDFQSFLNQFQVDSEPSKEDFISIDWQVFTTIIKNHFPNAEVIVRSFEQASKIGLISDFKTITGLSEWKLKPLNEPKNVGLNKYGMYIMTHSDFLDKTDKEILFRAIWTDDLFKKSVIGETYHLLSLTQRITIYQKYFNTNKELFGFSDEQMEEFYYPKDPDKSASDGITIDRELFERLIYNLVSVQKKTLIIKLLFIRKRTIDVLPPTLRLTIMRGCQPIWEILCSIYWTFILKA